MDFVVHSIAYADKNELKGNYFDTIAAEFPDLNACLLLFLHLRGAPRQGFDDEWRQHDYFLLSWSRARDAEL